MVAISRKDAFAALAQTRDTLASAANAQGVVTKDAGLNKAYGSDSSNLAVLAEQLFSWTDARDGRRQNRVTTQQLDQAVAAAQKSLTDRFGTSFSQKEIATMSPLYQLTMTLAREINALRPRKGKIEDGGELGKAVTKAIDNRTYTSESDYVPEFISARATGKPAIDEATLRSVFGGKLASFFDTDAGGLRNDFAVRTSDSQAAVRFLFRASQVDDVQDPEAVKNGKAFDKMMKLLRDNLSDLQLFKVGPKGSDGTLQESGGLYAYVVLGRAKDGKLAGVVIGSVET